MGLATVAALAAACGAGEHAATARYVSVGGGSGHGMAGVAGSIGGAGGMAGQAPQPGGTGGSSGPAGAPGGSGGPVGGTDGGARGGAGGRPTGPKANGTACEGHAECMSSYCVDGVCCSSECPGKCRSCNGATPGQCALAADNTDPRNDCDQQTPESCGTVGTCGAAGTCKMWGNSTVCDQAKSCDATSSGVIQNKVCDGIGHCVAGTTVSCNGFLCSPTTATCGTICGADNACVPGGFCSASKCVGVPNVVANGDLETGTMSGWSLTNGTGMLNLASATVPTDVHGGQYALYENNRSAPYHGPGVTMPTGLGSYKISAWGMQNEDPFVTGVLQIRLDCPDNASTSGSYVTVQEGSGFGIPMPQGKWVEFSATVDTADKRWPTPLCYASAGGLVKAATLYLNQVEPTADGPAAFPTLYIDDVVVQVPDGHNLIGNPNFESGLSSGWLGTSGQLKTSTAAFHGGARSLLLTGRTGASAGIKYMLPTGAARYTVSYWAMQTGTMDHQLQLQPSYTCIPASGSPAVSLNATPSTPVTAAPNAWVQVTQTFVMPPLDAPAGCVLSQASVTLQQADAGSEFPDIHLDDTSLVIPVQ